MLGCNFLTQNETWWIKLRLIKLMSVWGLLQSAGQRCSKVGSLLKQTTATIPAQTPSTEQGPVYLVSTAHVCPDRGHSAATSHPVNHHQTFVSPCDIIEQVAILHRLNRLRNNRNRSIFVSNLYASLSLATDINGEDGHINCWASSSVMTVSLNWI